FEERDVTDVRNRGTVRQQIDVESLDHAPPQHVEPFAGDRGDADGPRIGPCGGQVGLHCHGKFFICNTYTIKSRLGTIADGDHQIGDGGGAPGTPYTFGFDDVSRVAQACRVDERHTEPLEIARLADQVPCGSWHVGDDRAGGAEE